MADLLPSSPDPHAGDDADPRVIGLDSDDADDLLAAISSSTARRLLNALHDAPATPSDLADRTGTSLQNAQYHLERLEEAGAIEVVDTCYSEKGREMQVFAPADRPLVVFAGGQEAETGLRAALARLFGGAAALLGGSAIVQAVFGQGLTTPLADDAVPVAEDEEDATEPAEDDAVVEPDAEDDAVEEQDVEDDAVVEPEVAEDAVEERDDEDLAFDDDAEDEIGAFDAEVETTETPAPEPTETPTPEPTEAPTPDIDPEATVEAVGVLEAYAPGLAFFLGGLVVLLVWFTAWYRRSR